MSFKKSLNQRKYSITHKDIKVSFVESKYWHAWSLSDHMHTTHVDRDTYHAKPPFNSLQPFYMLLCMKSMLTPRVTCREWTESTIVNHYHKGMTWAGHCTVVTGAVCAHDVKSTWTSRSDRRLPPNLTFKYAALPTLNSPSFSPASGAWCCIFMVKASTVAITHDFSQGFIENNYCCQNSFHWKKKEKFNNVLLSGDNQTIYI